MSDKRRAEMSPEEARIHGANLGLEAFAALGEPLSPEELEGVARFLRDEPEKVRIHARRRHEIAGETFPPEVLRHSWEEGGSRWADWSVTLGAAEMRERIASAVANARALAAGEEWSPPKVSPARMSGEEFAARLEAANEATRVARSNEMLQRLFDYLDYLAHSGHHLRAFVRDEPEKLAVSIKRRTRRRSGNWEEVRAAILAAADFLEERFR